MKCKAAVELGKLAKGKKKTITAKRRKQLRDQLAKARKKRWEKVDKQR